MELCPGDRMNSRTRYVLMAGGAVGALALVGAAGVALWIYGQAMYWASASTWPLKAQEQAAVQACEDPGWLGLLKIVEQDLDVDCPATWYADVARDHLKPRHRQRARWLVDIAQDDNRPARARFRAGTALMLSGRDAPAELAVMARVAGARADDLVDAASEGDWPADWMEPGLRDRVQARSMSIEDPEAVDALILGLERAATLREDPAASRELAAVALDALGLDQELMSLVVERRQQGLPVGDVPADLTRSLMNDGRVCVGEGLQEPGCLLWLAERLAPYGSEVAPDESTSPKDGPADRWVEVIWSLEHEQEPRRVRRLQTELGRAADWVAEPDDGADRARRLWALLLAGLPDKRAQDLGELTLERGWTLHTGPPWSRALLAHVLGEQAGVPVRVGRQGQAGVWVKLADQALLLGPCGGVTDVPPEAAEPVSWPARAIAAQAAIEEAQAASGRGEPVLARRLARLAERLDPVGAAGVESAVRGATQVDDDALASAAIELLGHPEPPPIEGAEGDRQAQAAMAAAWWAEPTRCASGSGE